MAISLTSSAAERIRQFLHKDGGVGLRLGVKKTGCSGWAYTVQLADSIKSGDLVFEDQGIKIVVSPDSLGFLDGSEIDFTSEGLGRSFRFKNPNVTDECGCGELKVSDSQRVVNRCIIFRNISAGRDCSSSCTA
jgi:iron-sulfur cluster assembly protein